MGGGETAGAGKRGWGRYLSHDGPGIAQLTSTIPTSAPSIGVIVPHHQTLALPDDQSAFFPIDISHSPLPSSTTKSTNHRILSTTTTHEPRPTNHEPSNSSHSPPPPLLYACRSSFSRGCTTAFFIIMLLILCYPFFSLPVYYSVP